MKNVDPKKFLEVAIRREDCIIFKILTIEEKGPDFEFGYEIYNTDVNIGPEVAHVLQGSASRESTLLFEEQEQKKIVTNASIAEIVMALSEYLFSDRYQLYYHIEYEVKIL